MIRQYNPQRFRISQIGNRICHIGTVPVGTIARVHGRKLRVEAWLPREYTVFERGRFITKRISGGHLAQVRDLATNRVATLSDAFLIDAPTIDTAAPRRIR